jgi:hypothetical protein
LEEEEELELDGSSNIITISPDNPSADLSKDQKLSFESISSLHGLLRMQKMLTMTLLIILQRAKW